MDYEGFTDDRKTIDAVVRNLEVIGEASRQIPDEIKEKYSEIDWRAMIDLRDRIVHEYFGISLSIVWNIIKKELPSLKEHLKSIKEENFNELG